MYAQYVARMKSTEVPVAPVLPTKAEVKAKTKAKKEKIFADKRKRQIAKCEWRRRTGAGSGERRLLPFDFHSSHLLLLTDLVGRARLVCSASVRAIDPKKSIEGRTKEAYKTLFVARLSYSVTADDLKSEFSYYGPVKHVVLVKDKLDQSRGYAFVESVPFMPVPVCALPPALPIVRCHHIGSLFCSAVIPCRCVLLFH